MQRTTNPVHLRPFFGRTPVVPSDARRILLLVAFGLFFENYDIGLINAALPQITAELGIDAGDTGFYLGAIRLGGIGTFFLLPFADRIGRRRVFIASFAGMSIGTLATAFCQTPLQFVAAQVFARVFMLTAAALSVVILIEEFPAEQRGGGLGLLGLLGGLGYGACAALYALVDTIPFGWRGLYFIGVAPLIVIPILGRALPETRRFSHYQAETSESADVGRGLESWITPIRDLIRKSPRRTIAVGLAAFFASAGSISFYQYTSYFTAKVHGWTPADYSILVIAGGAIGILGSILGGRGSDRFGRRLVGFLGLACAPIFMFVFFTGPSEILIVAWGMTVFFGSAGDLVIRALSAELFPTSHRGTSTGWIMLVQTFGMTTGLMLVGYWTDDIEDLSIAIPLVALASVFGAVALLAVPETRGLELETISDDEAP
jgi:MFS family permease